MTYRIIPSLCLSDVKFQSSSHDCAKANVVQLRLESCVICWRVLCEKQSSARGIRTVVKPPSYRSALPAHRGEGKLYLGIVLKQFDKRQGYDVAEMPRSASRMMAHTLSISSFPLWGFHSLLGPIDWAVFRPFAIDLCISPTFGSL